jgi:alkylation response protein AidB-like acyl-CoA dehydrogenase
MSVEKALATGVSSEARSCAAFPSGPDYARERRQGRAPGSPEPVSAIVAHADIQRTLLTMKAYTAASRGICYLTAQGLDAADGPEGKASGEPGARPWRRSRA